MPLPIPANVRVTLYRWSAPPPAAPVATNIPGYLDGAYADGLERAEETPLFRYTHVLMVDASLDVRDDFLEFTASGHRDLIYLPDAAGTAFDVVFVERPFRGGAIDVKRLFLNRHRPPWPTSEL